MIHTIHTLVVYLCVCVCMQQPWYPYEIIMILYLTVVKINYIIIFVGIV